MTVLHRHLFPFRGGAAGSRYSQKIVMWVGKNNLQICPIKKEVYCYVPSVLQKTLECISSSFLYFTYCYQIYSGTLLCSAALVCRGKRKMSVLLQQIQKH
ncbi:hypothetical protein ILYODFUR_012598 [Ilyodon furcidens]|uniref:Uncharacterized protein n=1 Tax=Ilyodon furcidens TaxID=33524 RepID=A0ABV0SZ36_9TELE